MRSDGREPEMLRPVSIVRNFIRFAEGSTLIEVGNTRVICTVSAEDKVPPFLRDSKQGWVTAEYAMLPRSTPERMARESVRGRLGGRTHEIQRLVGRVLRSVVDLKALGERTLWVDCDVIQADGGTRTTSITGAFVALCDALVNLKKQGKINGFPIRDYVAATSVGKVGGELLLDLDYSEDSRAEVDMNVVMTGKGRYVEVQGTAEGDPFSHEDFLAMITLAGKGIRELIEIQRCHLGDLEKEWRSS